MHKEMYWNRNYKTNRPVTLEGCCVQFNQTNKKLEVAIKDYIKIFPSSDVCEDGKSLKPVSTWRYNVNISLARNTIKWASSYQVYAECLLTAAKKWWLVVRVACPELRWLDYWRLTKSNAIGLPVLASHKVQVQVYSHYSYGNLPPTLLHLWGCRGTSNLERGKC